MRIDSKKKKKKIETERNYRPYQGWFQVFRGLSLTEFGELSLSLSLFLLMLAAAGLSFSIQTLSCGIWGLVS